MWGNFYEPISHDLDQPFRPEFAAMDKFVAQTNITHLHEKLATEQDETKRQVLLQLLTEEEAKLVSLNSKPKRN